MAPKDKTAHRGLSNHDVWLGCMYKENCVSCITLHPLGAKFTEPAMYLQRCNVPLPQRQRTRASLRIKNLGTSHVSSQPLRHLLGDPKSSHCIVPSLNVMFRVLFSIIGGNKIKQDQLKIWQSFGSSVDTSNRGRRTFTNGQENSSMETGML